MKITEIKNLGCLKYELSLEPTWLERKFGYKPKKLILKDTYSNYTVGGQTIYVDEKGNKTGNGSSYAEAIDRFRRVQNF